MIKKIDKSNFYKNKKLFNIHNLDANKILVSKRKSYGTENSFKYFTGYNDDDAIRSLCNKTMSFKASDNKQIKEYTEIWEIVRSLMNIKFDSEPVYGDNDKYIKIKIKSYGDKINTNFQGKKILKENASYKCLSLIMLDSVIRANKKYYPQALLEKCKYEVKKNKMENLII